MSKPTLEIVPVSDNSDTQLDPFRPENLRLSQSFPQTAGVRKLLTVVPVRRPGPQEFVRVHPSSSYRDEFPIIELKENREQYLVAANMVRELKGEFVGKMVCLAITRQGTVFLWPVRLPSPEGKDSTWWSSAREATVLATQEWIRIKANSNLGAYDIFKAESIVPDPEWPELGFYEIIKIGFRNFLIDRIDHPVIKTLRQQV
jgi:hypothetical protein